MELIQKTVRYNQEGKRTFDQFYLDEDYNVPDMKEDIRQIIQGKGEVRVEDVRLVENYVRVSGKLQFQILYVTDEVEPRPAVLEGKLPFEEMVYTEGGEMEQYFVQNIRVEFGTTLVHSRKISIRAMIEMEIGREKLTEEETAVDLDGGTGIYKKMKPINLLKLHTARNDTYRIKEEVTLPGTKENIGQLLLSDVSSRKLEIRIGEEEMYLRGELLLFCLYISEDGKTDWLEQTVPYEGRIPCSGVEEGMYYHVHSSLDDSLVDVRMDEDGEMRVIGVEGTVGLRMNVYEEEQMELLEDLYALDKKVVFDTREAQYEELLLQNHSKCKIAEDLMLPELKDEVLQICHSDGSVQIERMEVQTSGNRGIQVEGILHLSFLYLRGDDSMPFGSWQGMIPFSYLLECSDISQDVRFNLSWHVEQLSVTMTGSEAVEVKALLGFDVFLRKTVPMDVMTDVRTEEISGEEIEKQPGIVGYIVRNGDDLWMLAKKYMTTEEGIRSVNGLESNAIRPGDKLIICKEVGRAGMPE